MAGRQFSVSFNITGALDGSLMAALKNAQNALRGLGNSARAASASAKASEAGLKGLANSLNAIQNAGVKFKTLQDALKQTTAEFGKSGAALEAAKAKMQADAQAAEQLRQKLSQLKNEMGKARTTKANEQAGLKTLRQQMQELKRAYDLAKSLGNTAQMNQLSSQMTILGASIQAQQAKVKAAVQAYKELSDKAKQLKTELKAAEQAASQSGKGYSEARNNAERLKQSYQQQLAALSQLKASLSQAGFNVSNFAASESRLQSEINRVNAALERQAALANAQRASAQASQEMFNAYNNFQGALQTAEQIAAPFKSAVDNAMTFEHAMSRVKALTQSQNIREGKLSTVDSEMKLLTQQARDLGATTMFTATQAAEAMGYLGMAGWKTEQIYGTMPGMLSLAAAAGADLAQTADIVSDNMTAMGVPVKDAPHLMDVYAYALTNSNARLTDFGETMKYAAPVAKAYGATLDETAAMVMMMANAGIKGSMAGTSLRMGMLRLSGPPKTATKEMAKLGLSLSDAQAGALEAEAVIKGLGIDLTGAATAGDKMTRVLMQLHEKTKNLSQDEKLAAFKGIFGVNAETGWLALFDQGPEVFLKYLEGLRNADGYAEQVAKTMNDDTRGALIILESALDALQERVGEALTPTVRAAAEAFTPMVTAAAQWIEANPAVVQGAAAIAAALAGIIVSAAAVKLAFAGFGFVVSQFGLLAQAANAFRLGLMGVAVEGGGLAAAIGMLGMRVAALRTALMGLTFAKIGAALSRGLSAVIGMFFKFGKAIMFAARAALAFVLTPVGAVLTAIALAGLWAYQNWDKVAPVLRNISKALSDSIAPAIDSAMQSCSVFASTISEALSPVMPLLKNIASYIGGGFAEAFIGIGGFFASVISGIVVGLSGLIKTIAELGTGIGKALDEFSKGNFIGGMKALATAGEDAAKNFESAWNESISAVEKGIKATAQSVEALAKMPKLPTQDVITRHRVEFDEEGKAHAAPEQATATNAPVMPTQESVARHRVNFDEGGVAHAQSSLDTTRLQTAVNTAGTSLEQVQSPVGSFTSSIMMALPATAGLAVGSKMTAEAVAEAAPALAQIGISIQSADAALQGVTTPAQALAVSSQTASTSTAAMGTAASGSVGNIDAMSGAASGSTGSISGLGGAAGNASGPVSGLGAAAQNAISALLSAGSAAAGAVYSAASSAWSSFKGAIGIGSNAEGGIYRKGAFLTTFAERSPEAAIPIENTKRAKDLWTTVGQMLGLLPGKNPYSMLEGYEPRMIMHDTLAAEIMRKQAPNPEKGYSKSLTFENARRPSAIGDWLRSRLGQQQIFRREYGGAMPKVRRLPRGLTMPTLGRNFPSLTTPPTFPQVDSQGDSGGLIGRLAGSLFGSNQKNESDLPPINITLNLTINGQADAGEVQRGVESATPILQRSLAAELRDYKREQLRRSYA